MAKLSEIHLSWNTMGALSHVIKGGGYSSKSDNLKFLLAPSLPLLICHQLGTFRPTHGLILCSRLLEFMSNNKHMIQPINPALKKAEIHWIQNRDGLAIKFIPSHGLFSNKESVEEGVRQLLNNYLKYVLGPCSGDLHLSIKGAINIGVKFYLEMLQEGINRRVIGPGKDKWSIHFSSDMAMVSSRIRELLIIDWGDDVEKREGYKAKMDDLLIENQANHKALCSKMGM